MLCEICHNDGPSMPSFPITIVNGIDISINAHELCFWRQKGASQIIPRDWYQDLIGFHQKMGLNHNTTPSIQHFTEANLRTSLIDEEAEELVTAIDKRDLIGIADGIIDLIYVTIGAAVSYGIDIHPIWEEIHRTNMLKEGGQKRSDGKILKPEGWQPPKIRELLQQQGWKE